MSVFCLKFKTEQGDFTLAIKCNNISSVRTAFLKLWAINKWSNSNDLPDSPFKLWVALRGSIDIIVICDVFNEQICQFEQKEVLFAKNIYSDTIEIAIKEGKIFRYDKQID